MPVSTDRLFTIKKQVDNLAKEFRDNSMVELAQCCEHSSTVLKKELADRLFEAEVQRRG